MLNSIEDNIVTAMARAMFVTVWADWAELHGDGYPAGCELLDVAPETPAYVLRVAHVWAGIVVGMNNDTIPRRSLFFLFREALAADEHDPDTCQDDPSLQNDFGHYLAMEIMGHGVSWADDHAELPFRLPYIEYSYFDLDATTYPISDTQEPV